MKIKGVVLQGGADTFTQTAIDTNLASTGKTGWRILGIKAYWSTGYVVAATDHQAACILQSRITTVTTPNETEEFGRVQWAVANTAGVAVAYAMEPIKSSSFGTDRITVQPTLYMSAWSIATAVANNFYWELDYEAVKLTDLEVLSLLVGGA